MKVYIIYKRNINIFFVYNEGFYEWILVLVYVRLGIN